MSLLGLPLFLEMAMNQTFVSPDTVTTNISVFSSVTHSVSRLKQPWRLSEVHYTVTKFQGGPLILLLVSKIKMIGPIYASFKKGS